MCNPYYVAASAQGWINDHTATHSPRTDPYASTVLTAAQEEARGHRGIGSLLPLAADLADCAPILSPDYVLLEDLYAAACGRRNLTPLRAGELAATVTELAETATETDIPVLVWWFALISWAAAAS